MTRSGVAAALAVAVLSAGCASNPVTVRTQLAPEANFGAYRTFVIMTPRMGAMNPAAQDDPMLDNSMTNRSLRREIRDKLESRGYRPGGEGADVGIAYYVASRQVLDVTNVNYGYPYRPWWFRDREQVTPVTQGTVVIDVIDRRNNRLIWRGSGRSEVSDDPAAYSKQLIATVDQVLGKLPAAGG